MDDGGPVLFAEAGSSWWPLLWGAPVVLPGLLLGGPGPWVWLVAGAGFTLFAAGWVGARRRFRRVRLTPTRLQAGRETLPVARVAAADVGASMGAPVLGGSWLVPSGTTGVPLRLDDGTTVLAWARDAEGLVTALRRLLEARAPRKPAAGDGDG